MNHTLAASVAAVLMLGVSACSGDDPQPRIAEPTESPSATSGSSDSPKASPEPELPLEASRSTREGAIAFTKYFWEQTNYAQTTGDLTQLEQLVGPACETCQGGIQSIKRTTRDAREVRGGEVEIFDVQVQKVPSDSSTSFVVSFNAENDPQIVYDNGRVVERYERAVVASKFLLNFTEGAWRVDIWRIGEK